MLKVIKRLGDLLVQLLLRRLIGQIESAIRKMAVERSRVGPIDHFTRHLCACDFGIDLLEGMVSYN
jgi:hypothetical protein